MSALTESQATELHKAMIGYLSSINASKSADVLREELHLQDRFPDEAVENYAKVPVLARKWTSVARLHRKIRELESQRDNLQAELAFISKVVSRPNREAHKWLPSDPIYTLQSHRAAVTCIAFHPVYSSLASGSEDCTIKIWDWEFGELERTLKGHSRSVTDVDFGGQKGKILLASSSDDLMIKIWDPSDEYTNIRTLAGHDLSVTSIRFLRSGENLLASASRDASIRIWNVATGYCIKTIHSDGDWIYSLSSSVDGKWLVTGGRDQDATIWDVNSGEARASLLGHDHVVECCVFAPAASYQFLAAMAGSRVVPPSTNDMAQFVATGGRDKTVKLWDMRGRLIKTLIGHESWVQDLTFHPGGRYLVSVGDDCTIRCWDLSHDGRLVKSIEETHKGSITCIRWAPEMTNLEANEGAGSGGVGLQCVVSTGGRDSCVRIFK